MLCVDSNKARLFNEYFASVGVTDDGSMSNYDRPATRFSIDSVAFNSINVLAAINK